jgi:hypothetical protein
MARQGAFHPVEQEEAHPADQCSRLGGIACAPDSMEAGDREVRFEIS